MSREQEWVNLSRAAELAGCGQTAIRDAALVHGELTVLPYGGKGGKVFYLVRSDEAKRYKPRPVGSPGTKKARRKR